MKAFLFIIYFLCAGCASVSNQRLEYIAAECPAENESSADERRSCFLKAREDYDAFKTSDGQSSSRNPARARQF